MLPPWPQQRFPTSIGLKQNVTTLTIFDYVTPHLPVRVSRRRLSQQVGELLRVKVKQVPVSGEGGGASQFERRLQEDTERPEQGAVGEGAPVLWDVSVKDQGAFGPQGALVCEAVTAVPAAGGAVAALLAVGVGVVIAAVLDVARTESHGGEG